MTDEDNGIEHQRLCGEKLEKITFNNFCVQVYFQMFGDVPTQEELQKFKDIHGEAELKKLQAKTSGRYLPIDLWFK